VTTDGKGQLFVTCYYDPMIVALTPDGSARVLVGSEYLKGPATSRLDSQGRILVAEYALNLLLAFSPNGEYLGRLGLAPNEQILKFDLGRTGVPATTSPGGFDRLHMALSTLDGLILVADTWNHRLQRFSAEGEYLGCLRTGQEWNADTAPATPQFNPPIACPVAVDQSTSGQLLVTAWGSSQVLLFGPDGTPLSIGNLPSLNKPYDARFVGDGIVIADTHHGRVLVVDKIGLASS
jgi:outer membrane protein assembly factor BamB